MPSSLMCLCNPFQNAAKSSESETTDDAGRKPRRQRTSPSVYGTLPKASRAVRSSRRSSREASGDDRRNRGRLSQKSPPTLESHEVVKLEGSPTKMSGLWVEASGRKARVATKSIRGRRRGVGSRSRGDRLKRVKGRFVSTKTDNPLEDDKPCSSDQITSDDMKTQSINETEEGNSECYKGEQETENMSALFGDLPNESATGVGVNTESGRNAECIVGKSKAATSGKSYGSSVDFEAMAEGVDLPMKVLVSSGQVRPSSGQARPSAGEVRPSSSQARPSSGEVRPSSSQARPSSGQARPKKLKNLGDIVAKLRTENEKTLQHDANDTN